MQEYTPCRLGSMTSREFQTTMFWLFLKTDTTGRFHARLQNLIGVVMEKAGIPTAQEFGM